MISLLEIRLKQIAGFGNFYKGNLPIPVGGFFIMPYAYDIKLILPAEEFINRFDPVAYMQFLIYVVNMLSYGLRTDK